MLPIAPEDPIREPHPGLSPAGAALLQWMREHPAAPRFTAVSGHRLKPEEIAEVRAEAWQELRDPQSDQSRVKSGHDEWLVLIGVCTHLGCIPMGSKATDVKGDYQGWFCPCHGSHYDKSGRIRKGPAPKNLAVPPYEFVSGTLIRIG